MNNNTNIFKIADWQDAKEYSPGTKKRILCEEGGARTVLFKFPAGFSMPPHSHITMEQHLVLKGEYESEGISYLEGSYRCFKAHEDHGPFESKKGALVLVIWHPY